MPGSGACLCCGAMTLKRRFPWLGLITIAMAKRDEAATADVLAPLSAAWPASVPARAN